MPSGTVSIPATPLGSRLRLLRLRAGLTQQQVAKLLSTGANRISDWEVGRYEPRLPALRRFAELYELTVADLLEGGHVRVGDQIMIVVACTEVDHDGYTIAIQATAYTGGVQGMTITEVGVVVRQDSE